MSRADTHTGAPSGAPRTLYDKVWDSHVIVTREDGESLLWIDRHFVHEGSHHAFNTLVEANARVARPDLTFGIADHYVPTRGRGTMAGVDPSIAGMVDKLSTNCAAHDVHLFGLSDPAAGHRPRGGAGAGADVAGPHHGLRRQPHLDARCVRRDGLRHRRLGGGPRPDDADHLAAEVQANAGADRRRGRARRRRRRTSRSRSSPRSAPTGRAGTPSSTPARRCGRCRWRAG